MSSLGRDIVNEPEEIGDAAEGETRKSPARSWATMPGWRGTGSQHGTGVVVGPDPLPGALRDLAVAMGQSG